MQYRRFSKGLLAWALCAVVAGAAQTSLAAPKQSWTITDLGALGPRGSIALTVNNRGDVGGYSAAYPAGSPYTYYHAFIWQNGVMTDIGAGLTDRFNPKPGYNNSQVSVINDRGTAVTNGSSGMRLWRDGVFSQPLPIESGSASDLNNKDVLVGSYSYGLGGHAFMYSDGVFTDLGTLGGPNSNAVAINDHGVIVGNSYTSYDPTTRRGFVWQNGTMTPIGTFGGSASSAADINSHGEIIGSAQDASGAWLPYIIDRTGMHTLANVPSNAQLMAINDKGQVLGYYPNANHQGETQFLWENGTMTILNTLPEVQAAGWRSIFPTDLNDRGQVTGWGWKVGGTIDGEGFLLSPK